MKKAWILILVIAAVFLMARFCGEEEQAVEIPTRIQNYITDNFRRFEIEASEQEKLCTGIEVYAVELEGKDDEEIELTFDLQWNFLFSETQISQEALPEAIAVRFHGVFGDHSIIETSRLNMADGSEQYEVEFKKGDEITEWLIDSDGTLICESVGEDDEDHNDE